MTPSKMARAVFARDLGMCTSCGTWLDDAQPEQYRGLLMARTYRHMDSPANYLVVCSGCRLVIRESAQARSSGGHSFSTREVYRNAGFIGLPAGAHPCDIPVWVELPGGPIWYELTSDGRRVVTAERNIRK